MTPALFLNRFVQIPDFFKGLIYGVGLGLVILFVIRKRKAKDVAV
jgi:hypothetical protein